MAKCTLMFTFVLLVIGIGPVRSAARQLPWRNLVFCDIARGERSASTSTMPDAQSLPEPYEPVTESQLTNPLPPAGGCAAAYPHKPISESGYPCTGGYAESPTGRSDEDSEKASLSRPTSTGLNAEGSGLGISRAAGFLKNPDGDRRIDETQTVDIACLQPSSALMSVIRANVTVRLTLLRCG